MELPDFMLMEMAVLGEPLADIKSFYEMLHKNASRFYKDEPLEQLPPVIVGLKPDMKTLITVALSGVDKRLGFVIHRGMVDVMELVCAIHVTEAWTITRPNLAAAQAENVAPSEAADRQEALVLNVLTPTAQGLMCCEIKRNARGSSVEHQPFTLGPPDGNWSGRAIHDRPQVH